MCVRWRCEKTLEDSKPDDSTHSSSTVLSSHRTSVSTPFVDSSTTRSDYRNPDFYVTSVPDVPSSSETTTEETRAKSTSAQSGSTLSRAGREVS